ncbi:MULTISPECIES: DUF2304 domain-containing protein [Propionimicrobium]|uniref:DUF2304 domain-containing protein n=1 Tax=Propionimicrobium TaxID=203133 RepID=UPI0003D79D46|nr:MULTISPECIES: DUF2304 domain-containing protein [Propionimicrobium]ETJ96712.1 PF10066 family protein [Propionimicrobium sp. BV2F7]
MKTSIFFLAICIVVLFAVIYMLRSRKLREKYAIFWLTIGIMIVVLAAFPKALVWAATVTGFEVPSNLLFALAIILLLGVALQLSLEISRDEDKIRTLAEHVAILNLEIKSLRHNDGTGRKN